MRKALVLGLVLVTAGLAGCVGSEDGSGGEAAGPASTNTTQPAPQASANDTPTPSSGPGIDTTWKNMSINGGSVPQAAYYCHPAGPCENSYTFTSPANASAVVVELAWNASSEAHLRLQGDQCEPVVPGVVQSCGPFETTSGASPLKIALEGDRLPSNETGWTVTAYVDSTTPTTVEPVSVASVVQGELPSGYAKLG